MRNWKLSAGFFALSVLAMAVAGGNRSFADSGAGAAR